MRLYGLRAFLSSSEQVTQEKLDRFVTESTRLPGTKITVIWWWVLASGQKGKSFMFPGEDGALGISELWSGGELQRAMLEADRSREAVAMLVPGPTRSLARRGQIFVLAAAKGPSRGPGTGLRGYVGVFLTIGSMAERAIGILAPGGMDLAIIDPALPEKERLVHFHPSRKGGHRTRPQESPELRLTESLDIAGHQLLVVCDTVPSYVKDGYSNLSWIILIAGFLVTAACAWWLWDRIGHAARVELLVEQRTEELAAARDEALQSSKLKSQFLANVSHEIRTPLNAIVGMTEFLLESELDPEQREFGTTIKNCSRSLLVIVNDLLDMSRIEAGRLSLEMAPLDVREVATAAISGLRKSADSKGLTMTMESSAEVPRRMLGDAVRLQQVLVNLLHNAIKFTATGKVGLRIYLEHEDETRHVLRFEVHDTGPGLPPEFRTIIFRRFSQADGTNSRQHGGLGLGLAISRQIVELMQGNIDVTSPPGGGSTFWFTATFQRCSSESPEPLQSIRSAASGANESLILLVEDNPVNRKVSGRLLSKLGYSFHEASNGQEAVEAAERGIYAAILMDCQMPVMDGLAATARIRGLERAGRRTPIIALTANAMGGDREVCIGAGMDDYVSKPIDLTVLSTVLDRWVDRERRWARDVVPPATT
jgi:signal transduction histidine kinase/CheY-like chemotaxis protein